jgi:hypothetical protein
MRPFLIASIAALALVDLAFGQGAPVAPAQTPQNPPAPQPPKAVTPSGGSVRLGLGAGAPQGRFGYGPGEPFTIAFETQGKHVTITVRDGTVTAMSDNKLVWSGRPTASPTTIDHDGRTIAWVYPSAGQLGTRAQVGINVGPIDAALAEHVGLERNSAVLVLGTTKDGPAEKAGVRKFDILTQIDGASPVTQKSLSEATAAKKPGEKMTLRLLRKGEPIQVEVTLGTEATSADWVMRLPRLNDAFGRGAVTTTSPRSSTTYGQGGGLFVTPDPTLKSDLEKLRKDIERMEKLLEELKKQRDR